MTFRDSRSWRGRSPHASPSSEDCTSLTVRVTLYKGKGPGYASYAKWREDGGDNFAITS